jgi:hypothetical protein
MKRIKEYIKQNENLEKILRIPYFFFQKIKFIILESFIKTIGISNGRKRLKLLSTKESNELIKNMINSDKPFMIARYGGMEFSSLNELEKEDYSFNRLCYNAGFFPKDKKLLIRFRSTYFAASRQVDVLAIWLYKYYFKTKETLIKKLPNINNLIELETLSPYENSWIKTLNGKRVLIIHPFEKSIKYQCSKNIKIIPKFKSLKIIKAIQTIAGEQDLHFKNWFEALDYMKKEIDKNKDNFDIALIGCGAYGFPLAAHVKEIGKQSIHVGGSLQLLFGIKGKRWEEVEKIKFPKDWICPLSEDTPNKNKEIEGGCYW